jgi:uncharacterized protein YndB with AHSA1/START domain
MPATQFHLVTDWSLDAPPAAVWDALIKPDDWPTWWRAVEKVEPLEPGDASGLGACRRFTWRTALPYAITFNMRTVRVEPLSVIEGRADGELAGTGRWTLTPAGAGTHVRYDWIVEVTKPWMRVLAPLLRPVFAWNHNKVMAWGREGLARKLATAPLVRGAPILSAPTSGFQ